MYTQCPRCATVFRLSADVLRAAAGQVRCGRCGEAFSALARLAERPDAFAAGAAAPRFEQHAPETQAPQPQGPPPATAPPASGAAPDEAGTPPEDGSLEFSLPPGELDRIFVPAPHPPAPLPLQSEPSADTGDAPAAELSFAAPSPAPQPVSIEPAPPEPEPPAPAFSAPAESAAREAESPELESPAAARAREMPPAVAAFGDTGVLRDLEEPGAARPRRAFWLVAAAVLLASLLAAQIVDRNRDEIVARTRFGGVLRSVYSSLGMSLPVPGDLGAYELRQWGVTGDPSATGTLRVRASILNTAARFQPYPLLRVTLTDRFGNRVGTRDFVPHEYLGHPADLMRPGERTDVTINIVDPGKDAEGFEIDVCLRGAGRTVRCANDAGAAHRR